MHRATERIDCVTLDGDKISSKGAMSGGYQDKARDRVALAHELKTLTAEVAAATQLESDLMHQQLEAETA